MDDQFFAPRRAALLAALLLAGCGGGGSPSSSSSYPSVTGIYGTYAGVTPGSSQLRWTAPDGTVTTETCPAVTTIPTQDGARFSGNVDRIAPCSSQATFEGTVSHDGRIAFTLTQGRWRGCSATGGASYEGVVNLGSLLANGTITLRCDDGRVLTVGEQLTGSLSAPPPTGG